MISKLPRDGYKNICVKEETQKDLLEQAKANNFKTVPKYLDHLVEKEKERKSKS